MDQDFLGLSSDFKRIRQNTLKTLNLSENALASIKKTIEDIKQVQEQAKRNEKKKKSKAQKVSQLPSRKQKRRCILILRGSKIVKRVRLEKITCPGAGKNAFGFFDNYGRGDQQNKEIDFEFISTPFNEEIPPIKHSKLQKMADASVSHEQPASQPQVKPNSFMWNNMQPYMQYPPYMTNYLPPPHQPHQEPPGLIYNDKGNPKNMFWPGMPKDKMNMGMNMMNMYQRSMMMSKPGFMG